MHLHQILSIQSIKSGDGSTAGNVVTVTTTTPHGLSSGTPFKVNGVSEADYNISTKVASVLAARSIYLLVTICKT